MSRSPNRLLSTLSESEYRRISPHLHPVRLMAERPLPHCGETRVYFPITGACSIEECLSDGSSLEVATVGNEGLVGWLAPPPPTRRYTQIAHGTADYMSLHVFLRLTADSEFGRVVERFAGQFEKSLTVLAACTCCHTLPQRCARWIVVAQERVGRARFELTEPFLARLLGTTPYVLNEILVPLVDRHVIAHDGSNLTILDPIALKRAACSCCTALNDTRLAPAETIGPVVHSNSERNVVHMPTYGCTLCGLGGPPHLTHAHCLRALDKELRLSVDRTRLLTRKRSAIASEFMQKYQQFRKRQSG
jgi:hypothetical protein